MGERALQNRIVKLQELEAQQKAIEQEAENLKEEIKKELEARGTEELEAGNFIIRWKTISLPYVDDSGHVRGNVTGFVFTNTYGNVWSEPSFRELINRIVDSLNEEAEANKTEKIENFCPHMARHTYTSLAYSAGADIKIVSQFLGHASTSVTLDTYTHLTEDKKREQEAVAQTVKIS